MGAPESLWPLSAERAPLIGWALDGFPIYGPYDDEGKLTIALGQECQKEKVMEYGMLDHCNGKVMKDGSYAYFLSPVYPYLPSCLKGHVGTFEDDADVNA